MPIEGAIYINQLNTAWPLQADLVREGAAHLRQEKTVLKTTFPNVFGAVTASHIELSYMTGVTSPVQAQINTKGAIAGQTWTGAHVFNGTQTLSASTTIGSVTAAEIGRLSGVTSAIQTQLDAKPNLSGGTYTGTHNFSSAAAVSFPANTTIGSVSPTELGYVDGVTSPIQTQLDSKANLNGASYTGTHDFTAGSAKAPTLPTGTNTTDVATTAFVNSTALSAALPGQTGNAGKTVKTDGTSASWDWPYLTKADVNGTSYTAAPGDWCRLKNSAATTVTLPASPADGDVVAVTCLTLTNPHIVANNGNLLMGANENMTLDNPYFPYLFRFSTGYGWRFHA